MNNEPKHAVLVISPDPSVPGGVSAFVDMMKRHVTRSDIVSFYVGSSGRGGENPLSVLWRLIVAPARLMRLVRRRLFDAVHLNPSFNAKAMIRDGLLLLALRAAGYRRILFYIHGWDTGFYRTVARHALLRHLTAWLLNKAALVTVLGDEFRQSLVALGVDPARIAVTRTMYEEPADMADASSARPYILFLSRFDAEKGGRELIQGFAGIARAFPDIDLVMAGDGAEAASLRALADISGLAARIRFPGYVGGAEKARLLRHCAIFALPTYYRSEAMPVAMLEAMGAGKPLLVGAAGVIRSVVADGVNGVVLDNVTAHSVAAGLRRLLGDAEFAAAAAAHNRATARARFAAGIVTGEIEVLYRKVAAC
ncbi:MAG: glycosyltransferase family 4 protein [Alphaproteobacteria bacterium]|nr:glycosyltransferase family 4 protein [Alphaproteobacteria bacterium]